MAIQRIFLKKKHSTLILYIIITLVLIVYWLYQKKTSEGIILIKDAPFKISYNDFNFMKLELLQSGPGELGQPAILPAELENKKDELYKVNGFNARLSDLIALNRSLKDIRHSKCHSRLYLRDLPSTAVIIPFHNEHWSTLLRTAYSAFNRAPKHLLKEIIFVDDASTKEFLKDKLDRYLSENLPVAHVIRLPERMGLIRARLQGAKQASAEVYVFLDSHTECNTNWLPPLLEPIALDYKTAVCPFIDVVDFENFEYRAQDEGRRGSFDWEFYYKRLPVLEKDKESMPEPFESPVMAGGLFAISAKFFWEIGGYDSGLDIWGGEQYELSFKIWQCHGRMVDAPCSRIGHIYRKFAPFPNPRTDNFVARNYRRVAEVWMDEYKNYLYIRQPGWLSIDTGDLSEQRAVRERNKCHSFKWFMKNVAFDLVKHYPLIDPPDYCNGTMKGQFDRINYLGDCGKGGQQQFQLTAYKDIRPFKSHNCWDVPDLKESHAPVLLFGCHKALGNQMWKYDLENHLIQFGQYGTYCLDSSVENRELFVTVCKDVKSQKWKWEYVNEERLLKYDSLDPLP